MIKGYIGIGIGVVALFCLMWWGLNHYKSKAEKLKSELETQTALVKTKNAQITSLANNNAEQSKVIDELEFVVTQWENRLKQTKEQFEQAKAEQAKQIQSIRSKYDEARNQSNDVDMLSNDAVSLRQSACRYCDQDPYGRSQGADSVPD